MKSTAMLLAALALVGTATADPTATVDIVVHQSLFSKVVTATLPAVIAEAKNYVSPAISTKTVTMAPIKFSAFDIQGASVTFAAPAAVAVEIDSLYVAIPTTKFTITANLDATRNGLFGATAGIKCSGTLSFNQTATSTFNVNVMRNATSGKLAASDSSATIEWANLGVDVVLAPGLCKDMAGIVGNLDAFIKKELEAKLAPALGKIPAKIVDTLGDKLPGTLAATPSVTAGGITNAVNLIGTNQVATPAYFSVFPARDIEVAVSSASANVISEALFAGGLLAHTVDVPVAKFNTSALKKFLPAAYAKCPGCPVELEVKPSTAPTFGFSAGATFAVSNALVGVNALPANNGSAIPMVQLLVNYTGTLSNFTESGANGNTVKFVVAVPTLQFAAFNNTIPAFDVDVLNSIAEGALPAILAKFNAGFKGITIPSLNGNAVQDLEFAVMNDVLFFGADVQIADVPVPTAAPKQMM